MENHQKLPISLIFHIFFLNTTHFTGLHKTLKSSPISQKATNSTLHFYNTIKPEQFTEPKFPYNGIFVGADAKVILTVPP